MLPYPYPQKNKESPADLLLFFKKIYKMNQAKSDILTSLMK